MSKLVLISHGSFSAALKSSAEMIMGPQPEIATVSLEPSEGPEDFRKKFEAAIAGSTDVTVLADLKGGTPSNVAAAVLAETGNFDLYAGANLPMVISYLNAEMLGTKPELIKDGQAGVVYINDLVKKKAHH